MRGVIKALRPIDLFEILTRGVFNTDIISERIISQKGQWYLNNWYNDNNIKLETTELCLTDMALQLITNKEEAVRLEKIFKSWGLFYEVWSNWYGGDYYKVGFFYDYDALNCLYVEWLRNKKLEEIL